MIAKNLFIYIALIFLISCGKNKNVITIDMYKAEFQMFEILKHHNYILRQIYIKRLLVYEYLFNNDEFKEFNQEFRNINNIFVSFIHETQHKVLFFKENAANQTDFFKLINEYDQSVFEDWIVKIERVEEMMNAHDLVVFRNSEETQIFDYQNNSTDNIDICLRLIIATNKILELEQLFLILNSNTVPNCDREIKQFEIITTLYPP